MNWQNQLARVVVEPSAALVQDAALDIAGLALVDLVGVTLAGSTEPVAAIMVDYCKAQGGSASASIIGTSLRTSVPDAALANATIGHALDFDDSNFVLGGHPSVPIFPALLAIAQQHGFSGRSVLTAYVVGFEIAVRMARAVNFDHYEKGWHPTATLGVFGAAAGCAHLLGLSSSQVANAIGLAASMSSGLKANFGSMAKPFQVGRAAQAGVVSALMAQSGMSAGAEALEAKQGYFNVYNGSGHYDLEALGGSDRPEILQSGIKFKRYPCCGSTHVVIDAAKDLRAKFAFKADDIEQVEVQVNPRRLSHVDRAKIDNPLEGKFSIQYTAAVALIEGEVGLSHFTPDMVARHDIQQLIQKVKVGCTVDPAEGLSQPCRIAVSMKNGERHEISLAGPRGRDASDYREFMDAKFIDCATHIFSRSESEDLLRKLCSFQTLPDINPIMAQLSSENQEGSQ